MMRKLLDAGLRSSGGTAFQKVKVDVFSSSEVGFNWLGFKRLPNGALLCDPDTAGWIGALFWLIVLAVVIAAALR
jgi:hypothetical protein